MTRLDVVRWAVLLVPLLALALAVRGRPTSRREAGALLLAGITAGVGVVALHEVATAAGWWRYAAVDGTFRGLPVDVWIGWAVLWGPVPVALRRHLGLLTAVVGAAWLDVVAMPALTPLVVLGERWLWGEALGLVAVLVPAVLLGSWTATARRLAARAVGQLVVTGALLVWLLPTVAFELADGSWSAVLDRPRWQLSAAAQLAAVLALPGLAAVHELAVRGGGTPYPWDAPTRLVTSGPYAYLANPMQVSATALLVLLAVLGRSQSLALVAIGAVAFCATVAAPHERHHLAARWPEHVAYRAAVRDWWPRRWPHVPAPATVWLDAGCPLCSQLGAVLDDRLEGRAAHRPSLRLASAAAHPGPPLRRARYVAADGATDDGLAAVGRGLEHLHLGVAWIGWLVRLPGLAPLLQALVDALVRPPTAATHPPVDAIVRPPTPDAAARPATEPR